ncbi:hypothetical protein JTE90_011815 [Oedothorax gibbosus]|uniref:Uncharacterized protein n=1 Tax=Oedothorax gibbosus TaxID=931172 RepID=A0AAV6VRU4_9ARAC|nr:hypothetical protein JTE90_011815 [Oedothorax gibbosus]
MILKPTEYPVKCASGLLLSQMHECELPCVVSCHSNKPSSSTQDSFLAVASMTEETIKMGLQVTLVKMQRSFAVASTDDHKDREIKMDREDTRKHLGVSGQPYLYIA